MWLKAELSIFHSVKYKILKDGIRVQPIKNMYLLKFLEF